MSEKSTAWVPVVGVGVIPGHPREPVRVKRDCFLRLFPRDLTVEGPFSGTLVSFLGMEAPLVSQGSSSIDGVTPLRARALEAYYALRQFRPPSLIGTPEILGWLRANKRSAARPCESLVRAVLQAAGVPHRHDGRPRRGTALRFDPAPPFCAPQPWRSGPLRPR